MSSFGTDKAVTFRQPSTANLMVDSEDRNQTQNPTPWDFQITKPNSIMNGFFTRCGTTEVVLEWAEPNIVDGEIILDISGATVRSQAPTTTIFNSFKTVADVLNLIADLSGTNGVGLRIGLVEGTTSVIATGGRIRVVSTPLAVQLGLDLSLSLSTYVAVIGVPDLRLYRYLDFVSPTLTYNQDLKDTSTAVYNRDVLCRWYMAEDQPESRDEYGFPILMGYEPFVRRRIFNPPKQIKWDNNIPVGNLVFQVYDDDGQVLIGSEPKSNWLMTLQLSEN
jgi:hypothetical protein